MTFSEKKSTSLPRIGDQELWVSIDFDKKNEGRRIEMVARVFFPALRVFDGFLSVEMRSSSTSKAPLASFKVLYRTG